MNFAAAALALAIERVTGYPDGLYRRIGHPVEWMGKLIEHLENRLNKRDVTEQQGRLAGVICLALLLAAVLLASLMLRQLAVWLPATWIIEAILATPLLAQQSLYKHVAAVAEACGRSIEEARRSVAMIVGRDASSLDEEGVSRAALESLAENASDGVVAPALWFAIAGLPGIALYKAINTADSIVGHKSERYIHFGWASAKLDDLVNWPAARLTGILFAAAALFDGKDAARRSLDAMSRDARHHVSPNAGWPEAALAGAMDIRLGGPRAYQGHTVDLATMGHGRADLTANDIRRGLRLYSRMLTLVFALFLMLAIVF